MTRKDTVWGARHVIEEQEIERVIDYYKKSLDIDITKLEASAIVATKSRDSIWGSKEAKEFISRLRGL